MRTKTFQAVSSIAGLALLLGGVFVSPANAQIRVEKKGSMNVRNQYVNANGLKNIASFIATQVTNDRFDDLWRGTGTLVSRDNLRLDRQKPLANGANIQIQSGGATFATVIIPKGYQNAKGQQIAEVMRNVRSALFKSAETTVGNQQNGRVVYTTTGGPKQFTLNGPFSN